MKTKVLAILKPKAASLGFSTEELENVADHIATTLSEDATEEQITSAVESSIPYLKLSQTAVTRIVNAKKEKAKSENKKDESEESQEESPEEEKVPAWARAILDKVDKIEKKEVLDTRLGKFEEVVKDLSDTQRKSMISDFKRITFENDEDFESYLSEKKELIPTLVQDNANAGLDKGKPGAGGSSTSETDDFVKAMKSINEESKKD